MGTGGGGTSTTHAHKSKVYGHSGGASIQSLLDSPAGSQRLTIMCMGAGGVPRVRVRVSMNELQHHNCPYSGHHSRRCQPPYNHCAVTTRAETCARLNKLHVLNSESSLPPLMTPTPVPTTGAAPEWGGERIGSRRPEAKSVGEVAATTEPPSGTLALCMQRDAKECIP
jgi:hypothetical protein